MALIKEDGSIVANANTWVTDTDLDLYADSRGITINGDAEVLLIKAADYINGLESKLKGDLVSRDQAMAFPRNDLIIEGWSWSNTEIPRQVINAQLTLALEIDAGEDPLNPTPAELPVVSERVEGAVSVEYANPGQVLKVNKEQPSQTHIKLLLKNNGLAVVRS